MPWCMFQDICWPPAAAPESPGQRHVPWWDGEPCRGVTESPGCLSSVQQKPTLGIAVEAQAAHVLCSVNIQPEIICGL